MSPKYTEAPPCDVQNMQERSHAITHYNIDGSAMLPQFDQQRASACASMELAGVGTGPPNTRLLPRASGEPPIGYAPHDYAYPKVGPQQSKPTPTPTTPQKTIPLKHIPLRTLNSVRGALYDMQHFADLPPAQSGASPSAVTYFALTRDGRTPYLLIALTIIIALVAVILFVRSKGRQKS
jgi:hypothetical protein